MHILAVCFDNYVKHIFCICCYNPVDVLKIFHSYELTFTNPSYLVCFKNIAGCIFNEKKLFFFIFKLFTQTGRDTGNWSTAYSNSKCHLNYHVNVVLVKTSKQKSYQAEFFVKSSVCQVWVTGFSWWFSLFCFCFCFFSLAIF